MKYIAIPIEVDAVQFTLEEAEAINPIQEWSGGSVRGTFLDAKDRVVQFQTLSGEVEAEVGDWIVKYPNGETFVYTPKSFKSTYRKIE